MYLNFFLNGLMEYIACFVEMIMLQRYRDLDTNYSQHCYLTAVLHVPKTVFSMHLKKPVELKPLKYIKVNL